MKTDLKVEIINNPELMADTDYARSLFEIDQEIDLLSSHADKWDYFIAVASGLLCGMMDILWTGEFNLQEGRQVSSDEIEKLVRKCAQRLGYRGEDLKGAIGFLERRFPIPSDGNTPDFGGGLHHHLRDFSHHPTIFGLLFSLLTQFTGYSYGTDSDGGFVIIPVPERSRAYIGKDIPEKIFNGIIVWFFHLVSDVAGSSGTVGLGAGTGIPGPVLSFAKEISVLPIFKDVKIQKYDISDFLSKVFSGTIFLKRDDAGKIIPETVVRFDFRGELGAVLELGKQAIPVIANDVIVRTFYFLRRMFMEIRTCNIASFDALQSLNWERCKPFDNPTINRMIMIAAGVFTTVDFAGTVATKTYWVSVNYVGVGRFSIAVGREAMNFLSVRNVKKLREMYEKIERNIFSQADGRIYERIGESMDAAGFALTLDQIELLYNLEYYKTENDVQKTFTPPIGGDHILSLKNTWIFEWKDYMEKGFPGFTGKEDAVLHWYSVQELKDRIISNDPSKVWFRLMLLEAMLFEPYYPMSMEKDKAGKEIPSRKYDELKNPMFSYKKGEGDKFLDTFFEQGYYNKGYVQRLRHCYDKAQRELTEVLKTVIKTISVAAGVTIITVATAGAFAGPLAVALVGSNFAGLSGAALTSACLAYIGGGAIAAGGLGMAGGSMFIVGGGVLLGAGAGAGIGSAVGMTSLMGKEATIRQSAKLMVSVQEIFLNDEKDIEFSKSIYEQFTDSALKIEKGLAELRFKEETASSEEKKRIKQEIKNTEESLQAMKIARKSMKKFISSFEVGYQG